MDELGPDAKETGAPASPTPSVDFVPQLSVSLGLVSLLSTLLLVLFGDTVEEYALALVIGLIVCGLGATLGVCGIALSLRDGRHLLVGVLGTALSASLPAYLLAGMPWS